MVVAVGQPGSVADLSPRQRTDEVSAAVERQFVHVEQKHRAGRVLSEGSVPVQEGLEIYPVVSLHYSVGGEHRLARCADRRHFQVIGSVRVDSVAFKGVAVDTLRTVRGGLAPVFEREHRLEPQPLGQHVEFLLEVKVGDDRARETGAVASGGLRQRVRRPLVVAAAERSPLYPFLLSRREVDREVHRIAVHYGGVDPVHLSGGTRVIVVDCRSGDVIDLRVEVKRDCGTLGHVKVDVVLEGVLHHVDSIAEREEVLAPVAEHTRLVIHGQVHEVGDLAGSAADVEVDLLVEGVVAEDLVVPVHVRVDVRVEPLPCAFDPLLGEEHVACTLVCHGLVEEFHVPGSVNEFRQPGRGRDVGLDPESDDRPVKVAPALGRDDHHTVGPSCAVHCRGRRVLEDGEALDNLRVDGVEVSCRDLHSVKDDQR